MISRTSGSFQSFDNTRIYYERRGSGDPVVFCYGIGCVLNHWRPQLEGLAHSWETIGFDYRGHHLSDRPQYLEQMTLDAIVEDLRELVLHLGLERPVLAGHSFGAQVLLRAVEKYPELCRGLVFINGFATNPLDKMFGTDLPTMAFELIQKANFFFPNPLRRIWRSAVNNPVAILASSLLGGFNLNLTQLKDIEIYAKGVAGMDLDVFIHLFQDMTEYDGRGVFEQIQVPTLIVSGEKDTVTPPSFQREMHRRILGSEILSVPYGSHCTQLDMPEYLNLRIEKFLRDLVRPALDRTVKKPTEMPS